jgi:ABC-type bacteriocin/lantibiotic exporter with double-glycine peptidase domain
MRTLPVINQTNDYSCGEACVVSLLKYYGENVKYLKFASAEDGVAPRQIEYQLRSRDFNVLAGNMDWLAVRYWLRRKVPIIACYEGHWIVLWKTYNRSIIFMDPAKHGYQTMSITKFRKIWQDYDTMGTSYKNWGIIAYG